MIRELPLSQTDVRHSESVRGASSQVAGHCDQGDQASVDIAATDRGAAEFKRNGGACLSPRQEHQRHAQQCETHSTPLTQEICSQIFQTVYSMTRLSKSRQEESASSGIIPLLKKVIQGKSPLKQFALPILCDLANAGKCSRRLLWQIDGMRCERHRMVAEKCTSTCWRIRIGESAHWMRFLLGEWPAVPDTHGRMQDDTARVEDVLLEKSASDKLVRCFVQSSGVSFEGILDP